MPKVSHCMSSSCAASSFYLKTSIVAICFGISTSNHPSAATWDDSSVFQLKRAKTPVNILLVSSMTQLIAGIVTLQVQKGVFVEKGFIQGFSGQHQLLKPIGGCDARPICAAAAELLVELLRQIALATAAPLGALRRTGALH